MRLLVMVWAILVLSCSRVSNVVDRVEFECGVPAAFGDHIVKLFNANGEIKSSTGFSVRTANGDDMSRYLTEKGCLSIPGNFDQSLIIEHPAANEGLVLYPHMMGREGIQPLSLKTWRYKTVTSVCHDTLATNASTLKWPIDHQGQDAAAFENHLEITDGKAVNLQETRVGVEGIQDEALDISALTDGSYTMTVRVKQLFSQDKIETAFRCELMVDRKAPLVSMEREVIRLDGTDVPMIKAAPGEAISLQTGKAGSSNHIYACLLPWGTPAKQCVYQPVVGDSVTAPNSGIWSLKLFAQDAAGNRGEEMERQLQIHDGNLVAANEALVDQATLAKHSGAYLASLIASVKAYEKMQTLGSPSEYQAVVQDVRKVLMESSTLPVEEISRKADSTFMLGMIRNEGRDRILQSTNSLIEILETTGEVKQKLDFDQILKGNPWYRPSFKFCQGNGILVASRQEKALIYDNGVLVQTPDFPTPSNPQNILGVSNDCRYLWFTLANDYDVTTRQQYVYDRVRKQGYQFVNPGLSILTAWNAENAQVLIRNYGSDRYFSVLDLKDGSSRYLDDVLGLSGIKDIQQAGDGSWGVLTADKVLHILNRDLKEVGTQTEVSKVQPSLVPDEFIASVFDLNVRLAATADGATRNEISLSTGNFSYMVASSEYVVVLPAGSKVLQIWTRTGALYDEVYNRGDSVSGIWLSPSGYLQVQSQLYSRLFKLGGSITKKYKPNYRQTVGLQFAPDGHRLFLKEQAPVVKDGFNYVEHNLVAWDFERDQSQIYPVEGMVSMDSNTPFEAGYGAFTRDLDLYDENGKTYVAAIVRRGRVAIYDAKDLGTPLRIVTIRDPLTDIRMENWLLNVSVHPEHRIGAGAAQDGNIYIFDLEQGNKLSTFNIGSSTSEYPTAVVFSRDGKQLYAASSTNNVYLIDIDPVSQVLSLNKKVADGGKDLRANPAGTLLGVVGNNGFLNIYDLNLELKKQYNLIGSGFVVGQSVAFSPDGTKVYAGYYPGSWYEIDINKGTRLKIDFSTSGARASNIIVDPTGQRLAFSNGSFVQLVDLDVSQVYKNVCAWLKPRLPYIPDLTADERALCSK